GLGGELVRAIHHHHQYHHHRHHHHHYFDRYHHHHYFDRYRHHHYFDRYRHHHYFDRHRHHDKKIGDSSEPYYWTITVDPSGQGNFSKIQSAIDSVPSNNNYWVSILVKAGTYREKLKIPYDKPCIILKGEGKKNTFVVWDDHDSIAQSPTFSSMANNVVVKSISFVVRNILLRFRINTNSYNIPTNSNPMGPAVAAIISGDKAYFHRVGFFGLQDTLWDDQGRHYYKSCTIQGAMDFIFGTGQSLYEGCTISVIDAALGPGIRGFITAQGRSNANDTNGFVFKNCNIVGNGTTYLGRPWRGYARVVFYETKMSSIIEPLGWEPWNFAGHEDRITFAEYGNSGAGSNTSNRVSWIKKLDSSSANAMASTSFIDTDGWVKIQQQL
ncbi:putative pectinesterase 29, partial [Mucuna pruriens]